MMGDLSEYQLACIQDNPADQTPPCPALSKCIAMTYNRHRLLGWLLTMQQATCYAKTVTAHKYTSAKLALGST